MTVSWKPAWILLYSKTPLKERVEGNGGRKERTVVSKWVSEKWIKWDGKQPAIPAMVLVDSWLPNSTPPRSLHLSPALCAKGSRRERIFLLPKSVFILFISAYISHLWMLESLAPQSRLLRSVVHLGRCPIPRNQCYAKYQSPFFTWTLPSLFVHDRIKVTTVSGNVERMESREEWRKKHVQSTYRQNHIWPTTEKSVRDFLHISSWDHFMAVISRETSSLHIYCFLSADHL